MRKCGVIASSALKKALDSIKIGVSEIEVDKAVEAEIYKLGGDLSYKTVPNYNFATCITVNDQVVHGIPTNRKFKKGDVVSIDLAVEYKGWHTDCAWSMLVADDQKDEKKQEFLEAGEQALSEAIAQAIDGQRIGDISNAIQTRIEGAGFSVVRTLVGHGIGRSMHEDPEIPGVGKKGTGFLLKSGMTLAIEVIYTMGGYEVRLQEDGWTYSSADKSLGGLFEMTVVVGKEKAEVLTRI